MKMNQIYLLEQFKAAQNYVAILKTLNLNIS